ncbi:MAG: NAD(P)-dependent oxidoreductase [Candidatus Hodarchaeota archaeon]
MAKTVAIIFGKKEDTEFDRYTFPILGKPVAYYPMLAAVNSNQIDKIYVSTDSDELIKFVDLLKQIKVLRREKSQKWFTEEVKTALMRVEKDLGELPQNVLIMLANSPCVTTQMINNAISLLSDNKNYDSVVTAMRRPEFNPSRIFGINNGFLKRNYETNSNSQTYFLDNRVILVKSTNIINNKYEENNIESMLGTTIFPIIQNDGIWDIDYIWQVPIIERWLKQNGFNDGSGLEIILRENSDRERERVDKNISKTKVLITTVPFGEYNPRPLELLNSNPNIEYLINPIGRKLKEEEIRELISDFDIVIAGTEPITKSVLDNAPNLKLISRVGIGLDSVDLNYARKKKILISYTPDAPSPAVAELTIAHMINLLRKIPFVDRRLRSGIWQRFNGDRIHNLNVGIIGTGRVGSRVLKHLSGFSPKQILVNDLIPDVELYKLYHADLTDKETIYRNCDVISLHIPLTPETRNLITLKELSMMKKSAVIINTSRGGIINEADLIVAISSKTIAGAALDVFENEPYSGQLTEFDNIFLSCHMGSMTKDCRTAMEIQATEEVIRFVNGETLSQPVPILEYEFQLH